jgi:hypothetical protein
VSQCQLVRNRIREPHPSAGRPFYLPRWSTPQFPALMVAVVGCLGWVTASVPVSAAAADAHPASPQRLIFDTDLGNDTDDVLALAMIHALQSRHECRLLAVTITSNDERAAPFADALNTFYGRGDLPIGVVRNGAVEPPSKYLHTALVRDGEALRYPHNLTHAAAPDATTLLRRVLTAQPDGSVVIVQVGFSTNLARLLGSPADDISPLTGKELVARKVSLLSLMAGSFDPKADVNFSEYNVQKDIPSAQTLAAEWPTPMVWSGFEIGIAIPYPDVSIDHDFRYVEHHLVPEAYWALQAKPINRPTWDLTSVLVAVRPGRDYLTLSPPGRVVIDERGRTHYGELPNGPHRFLMATPLQIERTREALVQLVSQPPNGVRDPDHGSAASGGARAP